MNLTLEDKILNAICIFVIIFSFFTLRNVMTKKVPQVDVKTVESTWKSEAIKDSQIQETEECWKTIQYPMSLVDKKITQRNVFAYPIAVKVEFWACQNCGAENANTTIICNNCGWMNPDLNVDSDGDGMNDFWEIDNRLDPQDPDDAHLDPDNDDRDNLQEFRDDTDPWSKDSKDDSEVKGTNISLPFALLKTYQKPVKILFMGYIKNVSGEYSVQINWAGKTGFYDLGDFVRGYVIKEFKKVIEEEIMPTGVTVDIDNSYILCQKKQFPEKKFFKKKYVTENDVFGKIVFDSTQEIKEVYIDFKVKDVHSDLTYTVTDITLNPQKIKVEDDAKKSYTLLIKD